jgi:hypothetical protein
MWASPAFRIINTVTAGGILVPGGVITIDLNRERNRVWTWIRIVLQSAGGELTLQRDIVIQDASQSRELYREGPYDGITVKNPLDRIVAEIRADGIDQFLFKRQAEESRIGPLSMPSGKVGFWSAAVVSVRIYWQRVFRTPPSKTPPPSE